MLNTIATVHVSPVGGLEPGDLIAFEFIGGVISGKIEAIPQTRFHLTGGQLEYLTKIGVKIPNNDYECIGGPSNRLLLGEFHSAGVVYRHIFVDYQRNVAVFPKV